MFLLTHLNRATKHVAAYSIRTISVLKLMINMMMMMMMMIGGGGGGGGGGYNTKRKKARQTLVTLHTPWPMLQGV